MDVVGPRSPKTYKIQELILTLGGALRNVQSYINEGINWVGCKLNPNDVLGVINKVYEPTAYGAGSHSEKSDK